MERLSATRIKKDINEAGHSLRHDLKGLIHACNSVKKDYESNKVKIPGLNYKLFRLLCFNEAIPELNTHSYGFHTSSGRNIIDSLQEYYYEYENLN